MLPGDELLPDPDGSSTRAITIDAPASAVWPWLAQMGPEPARWRLHLRLDREPARTRYSHGRPRNARVPGSAARRRNRSRIEPDADRAGRARERRWSSAPATATGSGASTLIESGDSTRLISRNRYRLPTLSAKIGILPMEPGSLIMERRMLIGNQGAGRTACLALTRTARGPESGPKTVAAPCAALSTRCPTGRGRT